MQPIIHSEHLEEFRIVAQQLLGQAVWLLIPIVFWLFFKKTIDRAIEGFFWHRGRDFDLDDAIIVDGKFSRMVRYGLTKTVFYTYVVDDATGLIVSADKLPISNEKLADLIITKQIPNHSRPGHIKPITS